MTRRNISGVLNINKPAGITSHDVVSRVRHILGIRKVGHTGTLDPMATGVLIVCVGQATRLIEYLMPGEKRYRATIVLGQATTTYDVEGDITATHNPSGITERAVQEALATFVGTIRQTPPPFSAIKKNGVPLYKLARKGQPVAPPARAVHISSITLLSFNPPALVVDITCRAGTYIRSIAQDLGQQLGVGAYLSKLTRTANGPWRIDAAVSLSSLERAAANDTLANIMLTKEAAVVHLPRLVLSPEQETRVMTGQSIALSAPFAPQVEVIAAFSQSGRLVAILIPKEPDLLKPKKVFNFENPIN